MSKFDQFNFLAALKGLITGGGRMKDNVTPREDSGFAFDNRFIVSALKIDSTAVALTDSTGGTPATTLVDVTETPTQATINANFASIAVQLNRLTASLNNSQTALETNLRALVVPAGSSSIVTMNFFVPRDYDEATDTFALKLLAAMAGTTNSPVVTATAYIKRGGASIATGSVTATQTFTGTAAATYEFDLNGNGLLRDDAVTIILSFATHTTDAANIYGAEVITRSCLVSYHESTGNPRDGKSGTFLR